MMTMMVCICLSKLVLMVVADTLRWGWVGRGGVGGGGVDVVVCSREK